MESNTFWGNQHIERVSHLVDNRSSREKLVCKVGFYKVSAYKESLKKAVVEKETSKGIVLLNIKGSRIRNTRTRNEETMMINVKRRG